MRKIYIIIVLSLLIFEANAQTISGTIKDANTNERLIGVNIILNNGNGTATDFDGNYQISGKEGEQQITFKYIGYEEVLKTISLNKNEVSTLDIVLVPSSEQLSTVVVSAGRFEQKIEEITVSMEVIKPSLIENKNTTDIQTVMDQIPGVNITDGQANIRGGSGWSFGAGTRVLVMVDDMPLISGDAGQVQWKLIATENINQVEVIKGASSALYGSSALNGVINIRTAFPSQKDIDKNKLPGYTKVNMHFGLIDKPEREELNWNGDKRRSFKGIEFLQAMKLNNLDLSLGGNIFLDDGFRRGEVTDRKRFNINSTYKSKNIEGLSYSLNANFLFQTTGSAIIWDGYDRAYIPLNDEVTTTAGDTYNIDPSITYIKGNNRHTLKTRFLRVINDNSTKDMDNNQDNKSQTYYSDYQWQKTIDKYDLRITSGTTNEIVYAKSDLFNGKNTRKNNSIYTQLDKKLSRFNLSFGARYEHFKINSETQHLINGDSINYFSAGKPVFRAGINYQAAEATYIRSSWGQGFRFPSMAELFISANQAGIEIFPNPELNHEKGWSAEIGLKQGIKVVNWLGFIDIAAFLMQYDDMMEFSFAQWTKPPSGSWPGIENYGFKSVNVGNTQISGIEISCNGQGKINKNLALNILAGYTYMNHFSLTPDEVYAVGANGDITYSNSSSDASVLKYRYNNIAKIDAEVIYKKISLGGSLRYNDYMKNIDEVFTSVLINDGWYSSITGELIEPPIIPGINDARKDAEKGDYVIDARLGWEMNDVLRLGLVVNNILNREYMTRPATMMSPRTFAMQLALKI
jgi:outer membrane receptor protein involved in Fe transport